MQQLFSEIYANDAVSETAFSALGETIGLSRERRPLVAFRFGTGSKRISCIAGCHADEPVGPVLLRRFVSYLSQQKADSQLLSEYTWWIVPHANPDGEAVNSSWFSSDSTAIDFAKYLSSVQRELPGDDMEFGFPREAGDTGARPENQAIYNWWKTDSTPFSLHASLHSMAFAGGAWFLIDQAWADRCQALLSACRVASDQLGYRLHDIERHGEKGFVRIGKGFCTRPNSKAMSEYFLERDDSVTAAKFRPSSMEIIRAMGGDPLTLVSELPFFVLPEVGIDIGPPDLAAEKWKEQIQQFVLQLQSGESTAVVNQRAKEAGISPMPLRDQMQLQWEFLSAGCELIRSPD